MVVGSTFHYQIMKIYFKDLHLKNNIPEYFLNFFLKKKFPSQIFFSLKFKKKSSENNIITYYSL